MATDPVQYQRTTQVVPAERTFHPSVQRLPRDPYSHDFNLRDILIVIFKHKKKIMGLFLTALLLSPLVYYLFPVKYLASATLMVAQGREYSRPNLTNNEQAQMRYGLDQIISSEAAILDSNDVKDMAIKRTGADKIYPNFARVPDGVNLLEITRHKMESSLSIEKGKTANIIKVSFQNENPKTAALVVNNLVDAYIEKRLQVLNSEKPKQFLEKKVNEYQKGLRESEDKLEAFKQQHQVFALAEQKDLLIKQRSNLDIAIKAAQIQSKELQQKQSSLEIQIRQVPQNLPAATVVQTPNDADGQLLALQRKERELLSKYRENTPFVEDVRNEIRLVQDFIAKQQKKEPGARMVDPLHQTLQKDIITLKSELSSTEARITELKHQLREADHDTQNIDMLGKTFSELQRERDANEKSYQVYAQKLEETRISEELDKQVLGSVSIIDKAEAPLFPESKAKNRGLGFFLAVGALIGLGAGIGLAFLLESNLQGMGTPQKAEKILNLPVLSAFSYQR
jgi:polysaccharide biosynthesis protein PslE